MFERIRQGYNAIHKSLSQRLCQHLIGTRAGRATGNEGFIDTQIAPFLLPNSEAASDILANAGDLRSAVEELQQTCSDFRLHLEKFRRPLCLRFPTICDEE